MVKRLIQYLIFKIPKRQVPRTYGQITYDLRRQKSRAKFHQTLHALNHAAHLKIMNRQRNWSVHDGFKAFQTEIFGVSIFHFAICHDDYARSKSLTSSSWSSSSVGKHSLFQVKCMRSSRLNYDYLLKFTRICIFHHMKHFRSVLMITAVLCSKALR